MTSTINLAHNTNPRGPASAVRDALHRVIDGDVHDYPASFLHGADGTSTLTQRLAALCDVDADAIVLGHGGEGLLKAVFALYVRPGDRVFIPEGSWPYYGLRIAKAGAVVVEVPMRTIPTDEPHLFDHQIDVDALLALHAATPARMLIIPTPDNPTGGMFPTDRFDEVLDAFHDAIVPIDEAYFYFTDTAPDWTELPALTRRHPNVVLIRTFSKAFCLAQIRLGFAVIGADCHELAEAAWVYLGDSGVNEAAGLATLDHLDFYDEVRRGIVADRALIYQALRPFDVRVGRSAANFVLIELPMAAVEPTRTALAAAGIKVKWLGRRIRATIGTSEQVQWLLQVLVRTLRPISTVDGTAHRADYIEAYRRADPVAAFVRVGDRACPDRLENS
jgi:histidinol-phosphate aminotransferase